MRQEFERRRRVVLFRDGHLRITSRLLVNLQPVCTFIRKMEGGRKEEIKAEMKMKEGEKEKEGVGRKEKKVEERRRK